MCGSSGKYIEEDEITPGKMKCLGCRVKFWPGGEQADDPVAHVPLENKTGIK